MRTITSEEGLVYVLKEDMEAVIKERVSKVAQKARDYETQLQDATAKIETMTKQTASVDILTDKIADLEAKLTKSNSQFDRYKAISRHGLVDDDIIDAIEWAYERTMSKVDDKDRVELGSWLDTQIQDVENSHPLLRPHLQKTAAKNSEISSQNKTEDITPHTPPETPKNANIPRVNTGAQKPPETRSIIDQGLNDPEFYKANREAILKAYKTLGKGGRHGN